MTGDTRPRAATSGAEILIVGASLAGLLAAHALAEDGVRTTLLERAGSSPRSGAALAVDPQELEDAIGPARAAAAMGSQVTGTAGSAVPVTWTQLHRGLSAAAESDPLITLHHGITVTGVNQNKDQAWATTACGATYPSAAVIGADGYRSVVRRVVAPHRPDASFAGYTLWLGVADESSISSNRPWPRSLDIHTGGPHYLLGYPLLGEQGESVPGRRRLGWAWYDATRNSLLGETGSVRHGIVQHSLQPADISAETYVDLAAEARHYWPDPWREAVLDNIARHDVTCTPISEYVADRLVRGRIAIIGDAAHVPTPMTGMGFAASLADARALASVLSGKEPGEVVVALRRYQNIRLSAAQQLVMSGQSFSRSFTHSSSSYPHDDSR